MTGVRGGFGHGMGRIVGLGVALALALLLLAAREANAAKYSVAQCGWHVGIDAGWTDSTGGLKFRPDSYCATSPSANPLDGIHVKSLTREGQTSVWGTRFARWRWEAPPGTGITRVSGTWWHVLHDGMQQRIGVGTPSGSFNVFATAADTDTTLRDFVAGFASPMPALEDRLLCAKVDTKWCSLEPGSWSALRALTITIEDDTAPSPGVGGELAEGGWRRGNQTIQFWGSDVGGGIRYGETLLDGARVAFAQYPCAEALIGSEWRGTRMRPCEPSASGSATVATTSFSDGPHTLGHCATDFAGNVACAPPSTVLIDNNPPAHVREATLAGGDGWHRVDDFDLSWSNPDQGPASPIGGASWRIVGPAGYDSGVRFTAGRNLTALKDLRVPGPGVYSLQVWLRDEAGNEASSTAVSVPLRFDDVPPGVAFGLDPAPEGGLPEAIHADVADAHSGPAAGTIYYRRLGAAQWIELPTKIEAGEAAGTARLVARLPDSLEPGIYVFRADAVDAAGNTATTTRRADGTEMALRKAPPPPPPAAGAVSKAQPAPPAPRFFHGLRIVFHAKPWTLRNGGLVRFSGRILSRGMPLPRRGKLVAIQYFESATHRWRPVLLTRTDRSGSFHARYRFRYVSGTARIRLRAAALAEERWPLATRASHPVTVRVSG